MENKEIKEIAKKVFIESKNTYKLSPFEFGTFVAYLYNMGLIDDEDYIDEYPYEKVLPYSSTDVEEGFMDTSILRS